MIFPSFQVQENTDGSAGSGSTFNQEAYEVAAGFSAEALSTWLTAMPVALLLIIISVSLLVTYIGVSIYGASFRAIFTVLVFGFIIWAVISSLLT